MSHGRIMGFSAGGGGGGGSGLLLTIAVNVANYDIFLSAGSPVTAVAVTVVINSGVFVGNVLGSGASLFQSQAFAPGSTLNIVNNGGIVGGGGHGGNGANGVVPPTLGTVGLDAISILNDVTINNTLGNIWGGGAGSQGGASGGPFGNGGGGGGGQGSNGGAGGSGISMGGAGTYFAPGIGGGGAGTGSSGWDGATWGNPDNTGTVAGGNAIRLNGKTATITGGNNSTQIIGAVS